MVQRSSYTLDDAVLRRPPLTPALLRRKVMEELRAFHFKLWLVNLLLRLLPMNAGRRLRALLYRLAGFRIGADCKFLDRAIFDTHENPYPRLILGRRVQIGIGCHFSLNSTVTLGDDVVFGHYVRILTDTHLLGPEARRCGERVAFPVTVEDGVWVASNVTILPGVTIGRGSVVAAGAVVREDVHPNALVAGVPARVVRNLLDQAKAEPISHDLFPETEVIDAKSRHDR